MLKIYELGHLLFKINSVCSIFFCKSLYEHQSKAGISDQYNLLDNELFSFLVNGRRENVPLQMWRTVSRRSEILRQLEMQSFYWTHFNKLQIGDAEAGE